jgi:4-hydroxy-3-polyprenylbenzoate decarboxylase
MRYILERIDLRRDLHFQTETTIDTLDYSGTGLNTGSKVILAAYGERLRELSAEVPDELRAFSAEMVFPGVVALPMSPFVSYEQAAHEMTLLSERLAGLANLTKQDVSSGLSGCPLIIVCDDAPFVSQSLANFLWVTFTRSNPSHDLYGVNSFQRFKHWGCDQLIIDARIKPHHAPPLVADAAVEQRAQAIVENLTIR